MKVFIRCPKCGQETIKYDYHENTSSERYEYFNVFNMENYSYVCGKCKFYFSEWNPDMGAQPALRRLCMMYPNDIELQKNAYDYEMGEKY